MEEIRKRLKDALNVLYKEISDKDDKDILVDTETIVTKKKLTINIPIGYPHENGCQYFSNLENFMRHFPIDGKKECVLARIKHNHAICANNKQCYIDISIEITPPPTAW